MIPHKSLYTANKANALVKDIAWKCVLPISRKIGDIA